MNAAASPENIFPGNSEMARLMRAFDWSTSELGVPEKWPESLKAAVRICVGSRNPIVIWWGKRALTQIYNDGYMRILTAAKHPQWLGRSGAECWSEIMETMGPLWDQVLSTGEATWFEDFLYIMNRNLPREECYFTFSYSALRDDSGSVDGILCICYETSSRVIGDGRLRTLRDLGRTVAAAKTPEGACKTAADILATNPADVSFSLIYLLDDDAKHARLIATSGFARQAYSGPDTIDLTSSGDVFGWPLKRVLDTGSAELVSDLSNRFGQLPGGLWPESPEMAFIVPITSAGQARGFLVAGFSTRRIVDADYRSFFDLVAGHLSTAVANARAYAEERKRAEALAELDRAKTTFFSNISHEFRTPLTLLLGPLQDEIKQKPEKSPNLEVVCRNANRLLKLVNTLLEFSRIEASRVKAVYRPTDLATLTTDLASNFRSLMEKAGLDFRVHCNALREPVYVDRDLWERIVLNLLSNAFKFTFKGSVTVALLEVNDMVELSISDTGTGIAEQELPKIFDRFHRIEGAKGRTFEGTGIGLALVHDLVGLHKGSISVESKLGQGSIFKVTIPFGSEHLPSEQIVIGGPLVSAVSHGEEFTEEALQWLTDDQAGVSSANQGHDVEPTLEQSRYVGRKNRVLLADDNADMRQYIRRVLGSEHEIIAAVNGEEALAEALQRPPDLILADVMMPCMDGFELIEKLRAAELTSTIPIIVLSARAGEESRVEGLEKGADDYLVKPFTAGELRARVKTHLSLAEVRKRVADSVRRANFSGYLMMAQEDERRRLAGELHDDFSQKMALIEFTIKRLRDALGAKGDELRELLDSLSLQVSDVAGGLRAASHRLHPSVLENLGLSTALRTLVEEQRRQNHEISFIERGDEVRLPSTKTIALYRIAQEALRNAAKHAPGAPVRVVLIVRRACSAATGESPVPT